MNFDNVSTVIGNYTKNIGYQILSEYVKTSIIILGTIVDRVSKIGFSQIVVLFHNVYGRHNHIF